MKTDYKFADYVDEKGLQEIRQLENETGKTLIAFSTPPMASNLSDEQLQKIRTLEKKLCVRLVAYEKHD